MRGEGGSTDCTQSLHPQHANLYCDVKRALQLHTLADYTCKCMCSFADDVVALERGILLL